MNILAVGAHHDDLELGCGGTMAKFHDQGHKTYGLILTDSDADDKILKVRRSYATAQRENKKAAKKIGLTMLEMKKPVKQGFLNYDVNIMRMLEKIIFKYNIDTVFSHWLHDLNTDHVSAARITITAARHLPRVAMFHSNWYQMDKPFFENLFVDITDYMTTKKSAINCYKNEIKDRGTDWIDSFYYRNYQTGFQTLHKKIGKKKASEAFEIIKWTL